MTERLTMRLRRRESLITVSFTIFSVFLAYVSFVSGWSPVIIPVIAAELAFVWWAYISDYRNYILRAVILTLFACGSIFFYGANGLNYAVLIPTLCVFTVLFSLYQMQLILNLVILCNALLLLYHLFVKKSFAPFTDAMEANRLALQMLSLFMLTLLCIYTIHRRQEEDRDIAEVEEQMQRVRKIKDDFVANTSHELRTPIHTISGMSEILLQEDLPDNLHREVLDIQMAGMELQTIVSDILDYAALESDTLTLHPRAYNITSTINDIMNMSVFQNREKNLELMFDCDPNIPCSLYGDEQQLRRVMNDLVGNAIKFTAEGGVTLSVSSRTEDYGVNLIVSVKDTGVGLTAEEQENIFREFYQTDSDRNRQVEGMGLGLTISYSIIKKMGGFMTVRSEVGKGSDFSFSVPQKVLDDRPCISLKNPAQIQAVWYYSDAGKDARVRDSYVDHIRQTAEYLGTAMVRAGTLGELKRRVRQSRMTHLLIGMQEYAEDPLYFDELSLQMPVILIADRETPVPESTRLHVLYKPFNAMTLAEIFNSGEILSHSERSQEHRHFVAPDAKILVVDDNIMNLKVVEGLLRRYRIRITAATSGEEALSLIESRDFDFVFMDHMMPGMDGIECFHRIRSKTGHHYYQTVPIIALTANAIAGSREMFLEEGFNDFVAKPIDISLLNQVLIKYIPREKQIYEDADAPQAAQEAPAATDASGMFAQMEGIDMETALTYCGGSMDDFIDLARVYCDTGERYYPQLIDDHENGDWKNYAMLTHAIKSTSKTIGAIRLSEIALRCETAAKEADAVAVDQYHTAMLNEFRRVLDMLKRQPRIGHTPDEEAPVETVKTMSEATWKRVKTSLKKSLDTFEADAVSEVIEKYKSYSLNGTGFTERLKPVQDRVNEFDFAGAARALEEIGGAV